MLTEVFHHDDDMGLIRLGSDTFRNLRSFPPGFRNVTVVFQNTQPEREMLKRLGTILLSISLAGLAVVFVSSLFLADRALIPIKKSWENQKNFVADASHELRSPLAVMQTNLELVMGNKEDTVESQTKWLENIQAENRRMTKLVDDLLLLARADSNQQLMDKCIFSLHETVKDAVASYVPLAAKKNIQLELKQAEEIDFLGDEGRLKRLVVILIDNAIKYTPSGGQAGVILRKMDSHVELLVSDTGVGIEYEYLDKIFERFYRVDKARSRESGGTGLGLAIADWIVKEHKGTISVSSVPGRGSTFKVQLPIVLLRN
jgi:signal transduction histidine kinase